MVEIRIAIDLDGTLFPTYEIMEKTFLSFFGKKIDWEDLANPNSNYRNSQEGMWILRLFKRKRLYKQLEVYKGVRDFLIDCSKNGHTIIYWTARVKSLKNVTLYSLWKNNLPFGEVYFVSRKNRVEEKVKLAKVKQIDFVVEDELNIIKALPCKTVLVDREGYAKWTFRKGGIVNWETLSKIINKGEFF